MTAKILPSSSSNNPSTMHRQSTITLLDRVLDSVTCCSSTEHTQPNSDITKSPQNEKTAAPPNNSGGEAILPHLRFRPLDDKITGSSTLIDFYNLFLGDDAPHSFLRFHQQNGDVDVLVSKWRDVSSANGAAYHHEDATTTTITNDGGATTNNGGRSTPKLTPGTKLQRSITFITKISNDSNISTIPIGVTNTQTLTMHTSSSCTLESKIAFDFDGKGALKGMGQFLISNDVRGSEVVVTVVLREGDASGAFSSTMVGQSGGGASRKSQRVDTILENEEEKNDTKSFFSCFSHPLLLPPDSLCGSQKVQNQQPQQGWIKKSNSFVDIHGEKSMSQEDTPSHATHVGASLLSAIQAKNNGPTNKSWSTSKTPNTRFDETTPYTSSPEHQDVLATTNSRGSLKLKPIPSFELTRASSTEGHMAMRRLILDKEDMTAQRSANNGLAYRGLAMRIEMNITSSSSSAFFSRSKGSFSNLDIKIRRNLKKRVSRSWISWAESWCMRLWEEEESNNLKLLNNQRAADLDGGVSGRKRKSNVRPVVRRIGEKRDKDATASESATAATEGTTSKTALNWNDMEVDNTQWTFVRQSCDTSEEECGVEVACTNAAAFNGSKVARRMKYEDIVQKLPEEERMVDNNSNAKEGRGRSRWNRSPQVRKRIGR
ncbi:hypothetical protein ACHAXN_003302 [Cyclotella atomus]